MYVRKRPPVHAKPLGRELENMQKILISGPDIAPLAITIADAAGYELVFAPAYSDSNALAELIREHDPVGVVSRAGDFGETPITAARSLCIISKHGAGVDNIDVDCATKHEIQVIRATGANALSVAEHAIALTMAAVKRLRKLDITLREGKWEKMDFVGRELSGMRIGLVGAGAIAQTAARLFRGIGLQVVAYDPYADQSIFIQMDAERFTDFEEMLKTIDIISLHCPLTSENKHMLNKRTIALLPKGSYIVNAARGGLIDEAALIAALSSGHLAGAALDSFEQEPLEGNSALFDAPDLIVTPHVGASTSEAMDRVAAEAVSGIIDYVEGREIPSNRLVNKIKIRRGREQN